MFYQHYNRINKRRAEVSKVQPQRNVKEKYLYLLAYVHKTHFAIFGNGIALCGLNELVQKVMSLTRISKIYKERQQTNRHKYRAQFPFNFSLVYIHNDALNTSSG